MKVSWNETIMNVESKVSNNHQNLPFSWQCLVCKFPHTNFGMLCTLYHMHISTENTPHPEEASHDVIELITGVVCVYGTLFR